MKDDNLNKSIDALKELIDSANKIKCINDHMKMSIIDPFKHMVCNRYNVQRSLFTQHSFQPNRKYLKEHVLQKIHHPHHLLGRLVRRELEDRLHRDRCRRHRLVQDFGG